MEDDSFFIVLAFKNSEHENMTRPSSRLFRLFLGSVYAALLNSALAGELERYEFQEQKMGVPASLILYAPDEEKAKEAAAAVWKKFDELNAILSDWDSESEIIQVCRRSEETDGFVPISDDLRRALEESKKYCELTGGAFDATVGPIVKLWRRSRYFHELPPESALATAKKKVGLDAWELDERGVRVKKNVRFDVGGIAKGIVMDEALEVLRDFGITSALINASGDLRIGDPPPGKKGWIVGIASIGDEPACYRELANVGVASSGDANRYVEINGVRYSHIIDPRSCEPLTRRCVAAVVAPTATTADALASALCVLGVEEAPAAFEKIRCEGIGDGKELTPFEYVLFVVKDGAEPPYDKDKVEVYATPMFRDDPSLDPTKREELDASF